MQQNNELEQIIDMLHSLGITDDRITEAKMQELYQLAESFTDTNSIQPDIVRKIMDIFGMTKPKKVKVHRNSACTCGSNKKAKKCCYK